MSEYTILVWAIVGTMIAVSTIAAILRLIWSYMRRGVYDLQITEVSEDSKRAEEEFAEEFQLNKNQMLNDGMNWEFTQSDTDILKRSFSDISIPRSKSLDF